MRFFFIVFFASYSLMHLYVFYRVRAAFVTGRTAMLLLFAFMVFMVCAPALIRYAENQGFDTTAHILSYAGYLWLGLIFLFISFSLPLELYRGVSWLLSAVFHKEIIPFLFSRQSALFLPLFLAVAISCYGYFEALDPRAEHVVIKTGKIPPDIGKVRIAQISDVHLGLIVRQERLKRILEKVRESSPDIFVSTGDLVDGQINKMEGLAELLQEIQAPYGKFAITGNHEYYAGLDQALKFTERAGFTILRGESRVVQDLITIAGVEDPAGSLTGQMSGMKEKDLLSSLPRDRFILFLKHRPLVDRESLGKFDLQLSGHTHKGQIFPFSIATWFYYPIHSGCLNPVDGCYLYVSRGSGTWGPPIRFLSPPEVTVIDLVREDGS